MTVVCKHECLMFRHWTTIQATKIDFHSYTKRLLWSKGFCSLYIKQILVVKYKALDYVWCVQELRKRPCRATVGNCVGWQSRHGCNGTNGHRWPKRIPSISPTRRKYSCLCVSLFMHAHFYNACTFLQCLHFEAYSDDSCYKYYIEKGGFTFWSCQMVGEGLRHPV